MQLQHGTSILVTDGRKALLLSNEGDTEFLDLRLVQKWEQHLDLDRDLRSGAPGHAFSSHDGGTRRSAYEEPDLHEAAEALFLTKLAGVMHERLSGGAIKELIIVAPPRALGELRKQISEPLRAVVTAEIAKDLVKHPIARIERLLAAYSESAEMA
jgi:protein required for attachment to host cells